MPSNNDSARTNCRLAQAFFRASLVAALMIVFSIGSVAQTASRPDRGTRPAGSYSVSDVENISLTNGNVNLSIPLASLPPMAGGQLSLALRAIYNSKLWDTTRYETKNDPLAATYVVTQPQASNLGGWRIGYMYDITVHNAREDYDWLTPPTSDPDYSYLVNSGWWKVTLTTPDGAQHELRPLDYSPFPISGVREHLRGYYSTSPYGSVAMRYYSFDGSYLYAILNQSGSSTTWTVYEKDGTRIVKYSNGIQRIYDPNGNSIKVYSNSDPYAGLVGTYYQDEGTGREIRYVYNPAGGGGGGAYEIQYQTVGGTWVSIELELGSTLVQGKLYHRENTDCTDQVEILPNTSMPVLRSIILPQTQPSLPRQQFTFNYNSDSTASASDTVRFICGSSTQTYSRTASVGWGSLSQMTMPTGAVVNYSYSLNGVHYLDDSTYEVNEMTREPVTVKTVDHDSITDTWEYTISSGGGMVEGPDGSVVTEQMYPHDLGTGYYLAGSTGKGGLVYRTARSGKIIVERHWTLMPFTGSHDKSPGGQVSFNPVVDAEYTTLMEGTTAVKMSAKTLQYDFNGNVTQTTEYDWFDPTLVSRDTAGVPTGVPGSATVLRTTTSSYYNDAPTAGSANVYANRALSTATPLILSAPKNTVNGSSETRFSYDSLTYGTAPTQGNLTKISQWNSVSSAWIDTTFGHDTYGNKTSSTDPVGNVTSIVYDSATHAQPTEVTVDPLNGTGSQTTTTVYDYYTGRVTSQTDPNGKTSTTDYTNQLLGTVDPFMRPGVVTGPAVTSVVAGTTYTNQHYKVKTSYEDAARRVLVESDLNTEGDGKLKVRTSYDQLGRAILTERNEDGTATYTISAQMAYKDMGKITFASQPKRSSGCGACSTSCPAACTEGWTRSTRDALGRVTEIAHFGQSSQPPDTGTNSNWSGSVTTAYYANEVTVTDQAGKIRKSETDGLGRLAKVTEAPGVSGYGFETTYTYNALDNLTGVTQGTQTRSFVYDSLKRLTSATNPESGTISYTYFDNGNLKDKTDARGITTEYTYDGLNRNTTVDYSNTVLDPDIKRFYDGATNGKGRYHYDYSNGDYSTGAEVEHTAIDSYDAMGRPLAKRQHFKTGSVWSDAFPSNLTYDLAGNVTSQTYPVGSSRKVNYEYDSAGRLNSFSGTLGGSSTRTYADQFSYWAGGQRKRERFGTTTNLYHNLHYNSRMQLVDIRLSSDSGDEWNWNRGALITYYSATAVGNGNPFENNSDNNGNVIMATHYVPLNDAISSFYLGQRDYYTYDPLNRIQDVDEWQQNSAGTWSHPLYQKFVYDRWGNRTIDTTASFGYSNTAFTVDTSNNRLGKPGGSTCTGTKSGMCFDAAGNLTFDDYSVSTGTGERTYDAENRMATAAGGAHIYTYDANGQRTRRKISGTETWQVYGFGGELLAEYAYNGAPSSPQKEYGYRAGQLLVTAESSTNVKWSVADHLGTPRIVVALGGGLGDVTRHDYLPFGEGSSTVGIRSYGTDTVRQKFTSYERDDETGLDYAQARYYAKVQGRFTSPDLPFADQVVGDPQSWNLYSYVRNNPVNFIDPDGRSTHTNKDGVVVAVYDDGDLGVYSHNDLRKWNKKATLATKGKGVSRMGETEYWDEFAAIDDKTGDVQKDKNGNVQVAKDARIMFGDSFDTDISRLNSMARGMRLDKVADESHPRKMFDLKNDSSIAPHGNYTGKLLNGKYASARSAGDYLAGYNGATSTLTGLSCCGYIDYIIYANMAGALHQGKWEGGATTFRKIMGGQTYGPPPYYGENPYAGRRIRAGFNRGVRERNQ